MSVIDAHSLMDKHLMGLDVSDIQNVYQTLHENNQLLVGNNMAVKRSHPDEHESEPSSKHYRTEMPTISKFVPLAIPISQVNVTPSYSDSNDGAFFEQPHTGVEWADAINNAAEAALPRNTGYANLSEQILHQYNTSLFEKINPGHGQEMAEKIRQTLRFSAEMLNTGTFGDVKARTQLTPSERSDRVAQGFAAFSNLKKASVYAIGGKEGLKRYYEMEALANVDFFASTIVHQFQQGPSTEFVSSYFKENTYFVEAITRLKKTRDRSNRYEIADLEFESEQHAEEAMRELVVITKHAGEKTPNSKFSLALFFSVLEKIKVKWSATSKEAPVIITEKVSKETKQDDRPLKERFKDKTISFIIGTLKFMLALFLVMGSWATVYYAAAQFINPTENVKNIMDEAKVALNDTLKQEEITKARQKEMEKVIDEKKEYLYGPVGKKIESFSLLQNLISTRTMNGADLLGAVDRYDVLAAQQPIVNEFSDELMNKYYEKITETIIYPEKKENRYDYLLDMDQLLNKREIFNNAVKEGRINDAYNAMDYIGTTAGGLFGGVAVGLKKNFVELITTFKELTQQQVDLEFLKKHADSLKLISSEAKKALENIEFTRSSSPVYTGIFKWLAEYDVAQWFTDEKDVVGRYGPGNNAMRIFEQLGLDAFRQIETLWTDTVKDFGVWSGMSELGIVNRTAEFFMRSFSFGLNATLLLLNNAWISTIINLYVSFTTAPYKLLVSIANRAVMELYLIMTGEPSIYSFGLFQYNRSKAAIDRYKQTVLARLFHAATNALDVFPAQVKTLFNFIHSMKLISNYCGLIMQIFFTNIWTAILYGVPTVILSGGLIAIFLYVAYHYGGINFLRHICNFYIKHPNYTALSVLFAQIITCKLIGNGLEEFNKKFYIPLSEEANKILSKGGSFVEFWDNLPKIQNIPSIPLLPSLALPMANFQ